MKEKRNEIEKRLKSVGLKVTPQRVAVMEVLLSSKSHPSAEKIIDVVRKKHPTIAVGTIYHILDTLVKKKLVEKVLTENNVVRYDAFLDNHFHLVSGDKISDYYDEHLFEIVKEYFRKNPIPNFQFEDVEIILKGKFRRKKAV